MSYFDPEIMRERARSAVIVRLQDAAKCLEPPSEHQDYSAAFVHRVAMATYHCEKALDATSDLDTHESRSRAYRLASAWREALQVHFSHELTARLSHGA